MGEFISGRRCLAVVFMVCISSLSYIYRYYKLGRVIDAVRGDIETSVNAFCRVVFNFSHSVSIGVN